MVLTSRQKDELHKAILEYLDGAGFAKSCEAFAEEAGVQRDAGAAGLLEKKWTSVVRLQKKVMDLETRIQQLDEELKSCGTGGGARRLDTSSKMLPRAPATQTLEGHRSPVLRVTFHPAWTILVTASEDASIKVWDYESGELETTIKGHSNSVNDLCFHPNGKLLDLTVKLWNFEGSHDCTKTLRGHEHNVSSVVFTPSGDHLVSASRDQTIRVWETTTGYCIKTLHGHSEWVRQVAVHPTAPMIASCSNDQTVRVWNLDTATELALLRGHDHVVECVAFAPERTCAVLSKYLPSGEGGGAKDGAGDFVVSASRDKTIRLWHLGSQQCILTLEGHDNWVRSVVFHHSGDYLLSCSDDKSVKMWDLGAARCYKTLNEAHPHFVTTIAINPRATHVATGSVDKSAKVWACS